MTLHSKYIDIWSLCPYCSYDSFYNSFLSFYVNFYPFIQLIPSSSCHTMHNVIRQVTLYYLPILDLSIRLPNREARIFICTEQVSTASESSSSVLYTSASQLQSWGCIALNSFYLSLMPSSHCMIFIVRSLLFSHCPLG